MESSIAVFLMRQLACEQLPTKYGCAHYGEATYFVPRCHMCVPEPSLVEQAANAACIFSGFRNELSAGHTFSAFWL